MVGSWVDADDQATIETTIEWTKNRNFLPPLVRGRDTRPGRHVGHADHRLGPADKQIRSWVFDSDGGFSEATWTHKGDRWFIQNNGTLDGRAEVDVAQHSHVRR